MDGQVRVEAGQAAREADEEPAEVLAAPVRLELVEHWRGLGGHYPD